MPTTPTRTYVTPKVAGTCTDCGQESDDLRWFPFTAKACPECAAKRQAKADEERKQGHVCYRCHQPYSLCVC